MGFEYHGQRFAAAAPTVIAITVCRGAPVQSRFNDFIPCGQHGAQQTGVPHRSRIAAAGARVKPPTYWNLRKTGCVSMVIPPAVTRPPARCMPDARAPRAGQGMRCPCRRSQCRGTDARPVRPRHALHSAADALQIAGAAADKLDVVQDIALQIKRI